jgi:P4 family phage/plasmid primase-like protien
MFSRKCEHKYSEYDVDAFVDKATYKDGGANIGTLMHWLKQDSIEVFKELNRNKLHSLILKGCNKTHHDVAHVVYHLLKDEFRYSNGTWYRFKGHRWETCEKEVELSLKISSVVFKEFARVAAYYSSKASASDNEAEQKQLTGTSIALNEVGLDLKKATYKKALITECQTLFLDKDFSEKIDSKPNLLAFDNGVYDLDAGVFRDGQPDDYVSMSCGYDYDPNVDVAYVNEVTNFINEIMPNKPMVDYLLTTLGYGLHGNKTQEFFQVWTGTGGNGKGLLTSLLQCALGEYYYEPDSKIYTTSKQTSSGANPEIYAIKGKRVIVSQEIDASAQIKNGFIKSLTGNDKLQGRELYQRNFVEFRGQCLPIICCNEIPKFEAFDGGIERRTNIVPFKFKFVENPVMANHKMIDMTLKSKFTNDVQYHQAFIKILVDAYRQYVANGCKINKPDEVVEMTKQYMEDVNVIRAFINEFVEITNNDDDMIAANDFKERFAAENSDCIKKNDAKWIKSQMAQNGFTSVKNTRRGTYCMSMVYRGMKWKQVDELEDFDELDM